MTPQNEPSTLRNALTILRRRYWVVLALMAIAVATALVLSFLQDETYKAESSMRFKDLAESYAAVSLFPDQGELPQQVPAQGAEFATSPGVLEARITRLKLTIKPSGASR